MDNDSDYIVPRYKLIMTWDMSTPTPEDYYRWVIQEMLPAMQDMGVFITEAWHTAYGDYPLRMASFVSEDFETIHGMLESDRWDMLENEFLTYVRNLDKQVVSYRQGFQFIRE